MSLNLKENFPSQEKALQQIEFPSSLHRELRTVLPGKLALDSKGIKNLPVFFVKLIG